jgi:hypothetical protein
MVHRVTLSISEELKCWHIPVAWCGKITDGLSLAKLTKYHAICIERAENKNASVMQYVRFPTHFSVHPRKFHDNNNMKETWREHRRARKKEMSSKFSLKILIAIGSLGAMHVDERTFARMRVGCMWTRYITWYTANLVRQAPMFPNNTLPPSYCKRSGTRLLQNVSVYCELVQSGTSQDQIKFYIYF